jgi:uncharacterized repeat protein (TIGR01451 family)
MRHTSIFGRVSRAIVGFALPTTLLLAGLGLSTSALAAGIGVSMSITPSSPGSINPGDTTSFRISLTNNDPGSVLTGVGMTDNMPTTVGADGPIVVTGSAVTAYTCTAGDGTPFTPTGTVSAAVGQSTISLVGGTIPVAVGGGASGRCDIDVQVTSTRQTGVVINTINVGQVIADGPLQNASIAQQSITISPLTAPSISKSFSKAVLTAGDPSEVLTITITNPDSVALPLNDGSPGDSSAFAIRDTLPGSNLKVAPTPNASTTCAGMTFTPAAGDTVLTGIGGSVPANSSCTLSVNLIATVTGSFQTDITNTIHAASDFGNKRGLVPASDATANISIRSVLSVGKGFTVGTVAAGEQSTMTITLANGSPVSTIAMTSLTDDPIQGAGATGGTLTVTGAPTGDANCVGATFAITSGNTGIVMTGGSIPPNATCTITVPYTGAVTLHQPHAFTNTITPSQVVTVDPAIVTQQAVASVTVVDQLLVDKSRTPDTAAPGALVQYTVKVSNFAVTTLNNVVITDTLPTGMIALLTPTPPTMSGDCSGGTLSNTISSAPGAPTFTISSIPGASGAVPKTCSVVFWAETPIGATPGTNVTNVIPAGGVVATGGATNAGQSTGTTAVAISANSTIAKSFSPSTAFEGQVSLLTITLTNISSNPLTNATFTDNLPTGTLSSVSTGLKLAVANPANATTTCGSGVVTAVPGSNTVSLSGGTVPARANNGAGANGTCVVQVKVVGPAGNYVNTLDPGALTATETYANGATHTIASPGPISASLNYNSALVANKSFVPPQISNGGKSTVKINLGNVGTGELDNVKVVDTLPAGLLISTPSNARSTCAGSAVFTAAPGTNAFTARGMTLPPSGVCDVLFDVVGTGTSSWTNTIQPGGVTADGGVQNVSAIVATLNNLTTGGIQVTVATGNPSLTAPGEVTTLTTTIQNTGAVAVSNMSLTNYFTSTGLAGGTPTGMQIATVANLATTCTGGIVTSSADGASISLANAALAAGATCTITANVTMTTTGTVQDKIPAGAILNAEGITNTSQTVTSLEADGNIGIVKSFAPSVIKPGDRGRLHLQFINPETIALTSITATDHLPSNMTVPTAGGANPFTTCTGATVASSSGGTVVNVSGGSLPAGTATTPTTCYAEIDVVVTASGDYTNTIAPGDVTGTIGGGPVTNPSPSTAQLHVWTPVGISKAFNPTTVRPGVPSTLTITLNNPNTIALAGAVLTDALPANVVIAQTPNAATTCAGGTPSALVSGTSVTMTGGTIPAGGTCTISVDVVSNIIGSYLNTIPVGALTTTLGVTNTVPATATLSLLDQPTISKQFVPVSIASGGISKLTIVLGNTNAANDATLSTGHDLVDTLPISPAPILVAPVPNLVTTCPGTPVAAANSGTITYPAGAKIPHGGCTITVDVTGSTQGSYNNFIPAGGLVTDIGNNPTPATANLVITPLGAISGKIFLDNNPLQDGLFNNPAGVNPDVGIANVTVNLTGHSNGPDGIPNNGDDIASFSATTTTDSLGNYSFTGLYSGTYTVTEPTQPSGTLNGITTSSGGTQQPATTPTPSTIANITLTGTTTVTSSPNNNFAEVLPSSLAGTVFLDQNNNGIKDVGDTPLSNVTIELVKTGSTTAIATTTTDANGAYSFPNVTPGSYFIREPVQPPNTVNGITTPGTTANGGTAGTGTPSTTAISAITGIILPPGVNSTANNFAELPSGRQISGQVYMDANNNGTPDSGEAPLANVVLNLTGTDVSNHPVTATTTTDANGRYTFAGLPEGTYTVTEPTQPPRSTSGITTAGPAGGTASIPATLPSTITGIPLTGATTNATGNNFGEIPVLTATVSGKVYIDNNNNGVVDAGETGINAITMTLSGLKADGTAYSQVVTTAPDGTYTFILVPPSNGAGYSISELQPSQYPDGKTTIQAGNPGVASSVKPVTGNNLDFIRGVTVIAGDVLPNYNFGEVGGPGLGLIPPIVNGYVYLDRNHDRMRADDGSGTGQAGWSVTLTNSGGTLICAVSTDANGFYQFDNLHCPNFPGGLPTGNGYTIAFSKDGNHLPEVPQSGGGVGTVTPSGTIVVNLPAGAQVIEQNLPLDPSGVVYDSSSRNPVAGAVVTISGPPGFDPTTMLTTGSATQTTGADGLYAFFLQNGFPSGTYTLAVTAPAGYQPAPSAILPACIGTAVIGPLPNPAKIQASDNAPAQSVTVANPAACIGAFGTGATTTQYYFSFGITAGGGGASAPILNNHIPLDPMAAGQILVTKTTPLVNVSRGDLVPYTITATNTLANPIPNVAVRDVVPAGFKYRAGSASLNGVPTEPLVAGRVLTWPAQTFAAKEKKVYRLILTVGAGVNTGKYVNQGWALDSGSSFTLSNMATATVNVVPDPTFDCPDVIGKVFDDKNANGYQDQGEVGIPAVRIATVTGLLVTTDAEGRFHVPCPEIPNQDRGSNYVMKLDVRTLPSGYRLTTENPRDIRLTRGKVSKLNFGATVHRVVRLELSDAAFEPNTDTLLPTWQKQLDGLPETLKLRPSVVRLNYQNGKDSPDLVNKRIAAVSKQIKGRWTALKGQYTLNIETEDAQ